MIKKHEYHNLRDQNTFGVDATAKLWIEYTSEHDLAEIFALDIPLPIKSVGAGSNLLFATDFMGTLLHSRIMGINQRDYADGHISLRVGAGMTMDDLVKHCVEREWWGIENLSGIPGTVGAAAVQNVGAYGVEAKDTITEVEAYDTRLHTLTTIDVADCAYGYRTSRFKAGADRDRFIITHVTFRLSTIPTPQLGYGNIHSMVGDHPTLQQIREAIIKMRDTKLPNPAEYGNAGSFFMNPVVSAATFAHLVEMTRQTDIPHYQADGGIKIPAAWLIDQAGWKGKEVGTAAVWAKQPLVIVSLTDPANPSDIIRLRDSIIADLKDKYGITLKPEVEEVR